MKLAPRFLSLASLTVIVAILSASCQGWTGLGAKTPTPEPWTFRGTIWRGADLGEVKSHCAEGLYLVAEDGYLAGQTTMLLLRAPGPGGEADMLSDPGLIGQNVEVVGKYPAQEVFCAALMCGCEDYVLAERIDVR